MKALCKIIEANFDLESQRSFGYKVKKSSH